MNRKQAIAAMLRGAIPLSLIGLAQAGTSAQSSQLQRRSQPSSNILELEKKVAELTQRVSALEQSKTDTVGFTKSGNNLVLECANLEIKANTGISMSAHKDVRIRGMNVEVNADANAELNGGSQAKLEGAMTDVNGTALTKIRGGVVRIN
jgi:hypothetical protein